jgi:hypothetical protein
LTFIAELQHLIDTTYAHTWNSFEDVKKKARLYKVKKRTIDTWKTPGEPAFVAHLASHPFTRHRLTNLIQSHLSPKISKGKPLVSGVFVHQKPKVKFGTPASEIELGDILFVRHHFQSMAKSPEGRAFLLQAKSTSQPMTGPLANKEAKQFDLYADWNTEFTFPHKDIGPPPSGKKWNLSKGPSPYEDSGFYGLVSNDRKFATSGFPNNSAWAVGGAFAPAKGKAKQVVASGSLAHALHSFIMGSHGRPWSLGAPTTDHWSHFVEEILENSLDWTTRVKRIGKVDMPRQYNALSFVNTFALANAYSDITDGAVSLSGEINRSYIDSILDGKEEINQQGEDWVASGGDSGFRDNKLRLTSDEERLQRTPGGMSVIYVATFGEGPLEPPKRFG